MTWMRGIVVTALAATGMAVLGAEPALAASEASVSAVVCADGQGSMTIEVTADAGATDGIDVTYLLRQSVYDGGAFREDTLTLAAGESGTFTIADLDDGDYELGVDAYGLGEDGSFEELAEESFTVGCDPAPTGPYTNPKAASRETCSGTLELYASNKPIGQNADDLQPVDFAFSALQGETTTPLAEFTLPDEDETPYTHNVTVDLGPFGYDDAVDGEGTDPADPVSGGGEDGADGEEPRMAEDDGSSFTLVVTADGTEILREPIYFCIVVEDSAGNGDPENGPALVNTGA